jgi:hypothetical protein
MRIPTGVIFIWAGNHANIPTGWVRETSLDGKYVKGSANGAAPNGTGGSTTHQHTSPAHQHSETSHNHTWTIGVHPWGGSSSGTGTGIARADHVHTVTSQSMANGGTDNLAATYASVANDPPYHEIIFIKPVKATTVLPVGVISLVDDSDFVSDTGKWKGHFNCDGNNSTPNLHNKYLKGAATSGNAGGTGGSVTNVHTLTHTHTPVAHTHSGGTGAGSLQCDSESGSKGVEPSHTHNWVSGNGTTPISGTPDLTTAETVEPAYKKLLAVRNNAGAPFVGMIALYLGALANIPVGWEQIDHYGKFLKITTNPAEIGDTGGSNTHTHASQSHGHTGGNHTHAIASGLNHSGTNKGSTSGISTQETNTDVNNTHSHTVSTDAGVFADANTTADSANNEPEYRTLAFIRLKIISRGGILL